MKNNPKDNIDIEIGFPEVSSLPLPSIIRFYDDFSDKMRSIKTIDDNWNTIIDAENTTVHWNRYDKAYIELLKRFLSWSFARYDATSVARYIQIIHRRNEQLSFWIKIFSNPKTTKEIWENHGYNQISGDIVRVLRPISSFLCEMSLCGWSSDDREYLRGWKWFRPKTPSNAEHGHGYYLSPNEEFRLVSYFDQTSKGINDVDFYTLRDSCILYLSYQFGIRPHQIASVTRGDLDFYRNSNGTSCHVTFYKIKQRSAAKREPFRRKVKREWSLLFNEFTILDKQLDLTRSDRLRSDSLFNLSPKGVSSAITKLSKNVIGRSISPTLFRHIAAQRMADLGMSQLELAEFMGHSDIDSCLVYFENSAVQGQVVNRALGLSPIYNKIQKIANQGFIKKEELNGLSNDHQVGGAAHGIPLAGIGGCAIGQSLCELSPAISCYTCPKFMPLHDQKTHKNVARELREVILQFESSGRAEQSNPAFTQLTRTMTNISAIIEAIDNSDE